MFGLGLGVKYWNIQAAGAIGGPSLAYLLRTLFSGVSGQPVTLTNGQVLDTAAEGVTDGSIVAVNNGDDSILIDNDRMEMTFTIGDYSSAIWTLDIAPYCADGLVLLFDFEFDTGVGGNDRVSLQFSSTNTGDRVRGNTADGLRLSDQYATDDDINVGAPALSDHRFKCAIVIGDPTTITAVPLFYYLNVNGTGWELIGVRKMDFSEFSEIYCGVSPSDDPMNLFINAITIPEQLEPILTSEYIFKDSFATNGSLHLQLPDIGVAWNDFSGGSVLNGVFTFGGAGSIQGGMRSDKTTEDGIAVFDLNRGTGLAYLYTHYDGGSSLFRYQIRADNTVILQELPGSIARQTIGITIVSNTWYETRMFLKADSMGLMINDVRTTPYAKAGRTLATSQLLFESSSSTVKLRDIRFHPYTHANYDTALGE